MKNHDARVRALLERLAGAALLSLSIADRAVVDPSLRFQKLIAADPVRWYIVTAADLVDQFHERLREGSN